MLIDFQEPYSRRSRGRGRDVAQGKAASSTIRLSAPNTTTDYSAYVTKVPSDADIVFFPTQKPGDAQTFAQQLLEQGKKAKVFGGDGSNDSSQFKVPGSYVSNFAPDITGIAADKAIIAGWKKDNPGKAVGSFGPPTYGAVAGRAARRSRRRARQATARSSTARDVLRTGQEGRGSRTGSSAATSASRRSRTTR